MPSDINSKISELQKQMDDLQLSLEKHPDAKISVDRWQNQRVEANLSSADNVELMFRHSCGCCQDAALYAVFYVKYGDSLTVYHPKIYIGHGAYGGGEMPSENWQDEITNQGFARFIPEIETYFQANDPAECSIFDD